MNSESHHNLPASLRWAILVAIALLAFSIRLPHLDQRPMHTDEAVNAYITGQLLAGENYHYDPQDRHGPTLYLAALPVVQALGIKSFGQLNETSVRLVPVIWGVLTILLFAALAAHVGFFPAALGALLFAVAPLPVYYSRYFIHETLFVAATLAFIISDWRALERHSRPAASAAGASAGFMLACKETALLHFVAFVAAGVWWLWMRRRGPNRANLHGKALLKISSVTLATFIFVVLVLYTWGGQHWRGPLDMLQSIPRFAGRATGEGHEKPFSYYLILLASGSGWIILALATAGIVLAFRGFRFKVQGAENSSGAANVRIASQQLFLQAVGVYAITISLIYSAIPYKTPWLALNLWLPVSLLAGLGFAALWSLARSKALRLSLLLLGCSALGWLGRDTWKWNFAKPTAERNPYAYSQTGDDLLRLPERLQQIATARSGKPLRIAVIAADPWPLPWYLRKFQNVGYWQLNQDPGLADIYVTSPEAAEKLGPRLADWRPEFFGVRPEVLIVLWTPPIAAHD